jgi:ParB/RepB/Spo0J family partition protein
MTQHKKVTTADIGSIYEILDNRSRRVKDEVVKNLAASMKQIGLMTPITVRPFEEERVDRWVLIAGQHRLAAAKLLGWERIDVIEVDLNGIDTRLWEISENLHRAELTKLQRDEQIAEWIRLTEKVSKQPASKPQGGRPESGVRAASRELGVELTDAQRAVKVDSLSDQAKAAAVEHGLDDNRSALLAAAKENDPAAQVAKIVERAAQKD